MQVYWWQGGLHFQPNSDEEWHVLASLEEVIRSLEALDIRFGPPTRPTAESGNN
jgi:hypothetical protein